MPPAPAPRRLALVVLLLLTGVAAVAPATGVAATRRVPLAGFDIAAHSSLAPDDPAAGPQPVDLPCLRVPLDACVVVHGTGRKVLLLGDSHAIMLLPAMRVIAKREHLTLVVAALTGCPWMIGVVFARSDRAACVRAKRSWYSRLVPGFDPDVVVLATRATDHRSGSGYAVVGTGASQRGRSQSRLLADGAHATVARLLRPGRSVVVVEPVVVAPFDMAACYRTARYADECDFTADPGPSPAETAYRALARALRQVHAVDLDRLLCPGFPRCPAVVDGVVVRKDTNHITDLASARLAPALERLLRAQHVLTG